MNKIKEDVKNKTPDILPEKITPESPKNIFGNKHNIAFRLKLFRSLANDHNK